MPAGVAASSHAAEQELTGAFGAEDCEEAEGPWWKGAVRGSRQGPAVRLRGAAGLHTAQRLLAHTEGGVGGGAATSAQGVPTARCAGRPRSLAGDDGMCRLLRGKPEILKLCNPVSMGSL